MYRFRNHYCIAKTDEMPNGHFFQSHVRERKRGLVTSEVSYDGFYTSFSNGPALVNDSTHINQCIGSCRQLLKVAETHRVEFAINHIGLRERAERSMAHNFATAAQIDRNSTTGKPGFGCVTCKTQADLAVMVEPAQRDGGSGFE